MKLYSIPQYEGLYEIDRNGNVYSLPKQEGFYFRETYKKIATYIDYKGYKCCKLVLNGKVKIEKIHRLVAKVFIPNPENKPQVNHIDGDKLNNNINNLEWCTASENQIHAVKTGLRIPTSKMRSNGKDRMKEIHKNNKHIHCKEIVQINKNNNEIIKVFPSIKSASEYVGTPDSNIISVLKGKSITAGGYKWKYLKESDANANHIE